MRDNTVGSTSELQSLITDTESAYILGLWSADGYFWSSSIGITNVDRRLVDRFSRYFARMFPRERIKLRVYYPRGKQPHGNQKSTYSMRLARQTAYQLYVNSRPLLKLFRGAEHEIITLPLKYILAYFAGRFDGDGSIDKNLRSDLRITYSNFREAKADQELLTRLNRFKSRVYHYRGARTYVLYICRESAERFLLGIAPYSVRVQSLLPRRDSFRPVAGMDGLFKKYP